MLRGITYSLGARSLLGRDLYDAIAWAEVALLDLAPLVRERKVFSELCMRLWYRHMHEHTSSASFGSGRGDAIFVSLEQKVL